MIAGILEGLGEDLREHVEGPVLHLRDDAIHARGRELQGLREGDLENLQELHGLREGGLENLQELQGIREGGLENLWLRVLVADVAIPREIQSSEMTS